MHAVTMCRGLRFDQTCVTRSGTLGPNCSLGGKVFQLLHNGKGDCVCHVCNLRCLGSPARYTRDGYTWFLLGLIARLVAILHGARCTESHDAIDLHR